MDFILIVATDLNRGIGFRGTMPWYLPEDLTYFKDVTVGHTVIMGRKTWESLPEKVRPLPHRKNCVITSQDQSAFPESVMVYPDVESALRMNTVEEKPFIMGGGTIYTSVIHNPAVKCIYRTLIHKTFECDTFFPEFETLFRLKTETPRQTSVSGLDYQFQIWERH